MNHSLKTLKNLSDMILRIEIDADEWVGHSAHEKFGYIQRMMLRKGIGKLANVGFGVAEGIIGIAKANVTSRIARSYLSLAETGIDLMKIGLVLNNAFVAKKIAIHGDYDELAQFMGRTSTNDIVCSEIPSTIEICRAFYRLTPAQQETAGIKFIKMDDISSKPNGVELTHIMILMTLDGVTYGIEICFSANGGDADTIKKNMVNIVIASYTGSDEQTDFDAVEHAIYKAYINSIDIRNNYIRIDGCAMFTTPRIDVNFDIHNIDIDEITRTIKAVIGSKRRRGYIIQGDPGTGKTVSIHKIVMSFPDTPVFWISADSISDPSKMRSVFRILHMFPGSIFVFDDIDGNDFSKKSALTTAFISCIDATSADKFTGVIILTINEPQRIHPTIKTRAERIDEVILVRNPGTVEQVLDVIVQRFRSIGATVPDWINTPSDMCVNLIRDMISNNFTHAHVASIISDLVELTDGVYDENTLGRIISRRIESIGNARMNADTDGHIM